MFHSPGEEGGIAGVIFPYTHTRRAVGQRPLRGNKVREHAIHVKIGSGSVPDECHMTRRSRGQEEAGHAVEGGTTMVRVTEP